jgi:hypothetical protein
MAIDRFVGRVTPPERRIVTSVSYAFRSTKGVSLLKSRPAHQTCSIAATVRHSPTSCTSRPLGWSVAGGQQTAKGRAAQIRERQVIDQPSLQTASAAPVEAVLDRVGPTGNL